MKHNAVLIVDDDPVVCKLMAEFLSTAGYRPTAISDSQKAVELFASRSFDLVIADYNMPVMTGAELALRVKTLKPMTPVCVVTAELGSIKPEELDVFDQTLEKPFSSERLTSMVADILDASRDGQRHVSRPVRYSVDWRVDYIPLASADLAEGSLQTRRATLRDISEHGLGLVSSEKPPRDGFCAFLIYPPGRTTPSLMVGEVRWVEDNSGRSWAGTKSIFWGSEREKSAVMGKAM